MSAIQKQVIESIRQILENQKVEDYLINPRIPEVLSNPAFLVVPSLGSLITIDVQEIPAKKNWWSTTLALIEDLFEIKVSTGPQTCCILVIISNINIHDDPYHLNMDAFTLLKSLFDKVIVVPDSIEGNRTEFRHNLTAILNEPQIKQELHDFWNDESDSRQRNYERISQLPFVKKVLASIESKKVENQINPRIPGNKNEIIEKVAIDIHRNTGFYPFQNVRVQNFKELFVGHPYYFSFDMLVTPDRMQFFAENVLTPFEISQNNGSLINVFYGEKGNSRNRERLRKLATYSRLISYETMGRRLHLRLEMPSLFLVLENDILGPEYAPERYLQMLISAGWKLIRPEDLTRENLMTRWPQ